MLTLSSHQHYISPSDSPWASPPADGWHLHRFVQQAVVIAVIIAAITGVIIACPIVSEWLHPRQSDLQAQQSLSIDPARGPDSPLNPSSTAHQFMELMNAGQEERNRPVSTALR